MSGGRKTALQGTKANRKHAAFGDLSLKTTCPSFLPSCRPQNQAPAQSLPNTVFDLACEVADGCDDTTWTFKNNILLGFINPSQTGGSDEAPGLFYIGDPSITYTSQYNDEFGVRNGDCPATDTSTGILCVSPGLFGQPTGTGSTFTESELDNFIPNPLATSPLLGAGVAIPGLTTDYNGASFTNPPAIGAFTYTSSSTPMPTHEAIGYRRQSPQRGDKQSGRRYSRCDH